MQVRAVLFDYDGTLRDSVGEVHRGVCTVFTELGVPAPTLGDFHREFSMPADHYYRERGITLPLQDVVERWRAVCDVDATDLFPDTVPVLEALHTRGVALALLSGHREEYVERHMREHGISHYFDHIEGNLGDKAPSMSTFLDRLGIPYHEAVYVGDFVSDMRDAKAAAVIGVGITRESGSREALLAAGATYVVRDLTELLELPLFA